MSWKGCGMTDGLCYFKQFLWCSGKFPFCNKIWSVEIRVVMNYFMKGLSAIDKIRVKLIWYTLLINGFVMLNVIVQMVRYYYTLILPIHQTLSKKCTMRWSRTVCCVRQITEAVNSDRERATYIWNEELSCEVSAASTIIDAAVFSKVDVMRPYITTDESWVVETIFLSAFA